MPKSLLQAAYVAPMSRGLIRDGAVVSDGVRIVEFGSTPAMRAAHPDAIVIDVGDVVLMPGLVNANTHLELTHVTRAADRWAGSFADWILTVRDEARRSPAESRHAGLQQCRKFGVTCVGDITHSYGMERIGHITGVRVLPFLEALGIGKARPRFEETIIQITEALKKPGGARGISPHAPYTVDADGYKLCLELAKKYDAPLMTHLAETTDETQFMTDHTGPFRVLLDQLGLWDETIRTDPGPPIEFAYACGLLEYPKTILSHVNYCDDSELDRLSQGRASVVYCPRTHAYFGHPPHRWREMLARGINVAVGTDSCASSPDLNIVEDLRLLHRLAPEVPPQVLWEMATTRGARALSLPDVGRLDAGCVADFIAFPARSQDPLRELLENDALPIACVASDEQIRTLSRP